MRDHGLLGDDEAALSANVQGRGGAAFCLEKSGRSTSNASCPTGAPWVTGSWAKVSVGFLAVDVDAGLSCRVTKWSTRQVVQMVCKGFLFLSSSTEVVVWRGQSWLS